MTHTYIYICTPNTYQSSAQQLSSPSAHQQNDDIHTQSIIRHVLRGSFIPAVGAVVLGR